MCFAYYFSISSLFKSCVKSFKEWSRTAVKPSMHGIVKKSLSCIKNTVLLEIWDGVDLQCFSFRKKIESTYQGRCNKFTSTLSLTDKVVSSTQIPARGGWQGAKCWGPSNFWMDENRCFQQKHNHGLRQMFLPVSGNLCAKRSIPDCVLVTLLFRKQCMLRGWGPLKGPFQLKKACKGPKLGSASAMRGQVCYCL